MTARAGAWWHETGARRLANGQTDEAIGAFRQATAADPTNPQHRLALARALAAANRPDEARQILMSIRENNPEQSDVNLELVRLASLFAQAGDQKRALDLFSAAVDLDATNPAALEGAGRAAFALGDYRGAVRDLTAAINAGADESAIRPVLDRAIALAGRLHGAPDK